MTSLPMADWDPRRPPIKPRLNLRKFLTKTQRKQKVRRQTKILAMQDTPPLGRIFQRPNVTNFYINLASDVSDDGASAQSDGAIDALAQELAKEPFPSYFMNGNRDNAPVKVNIIRKATQVSFVCSLSVLLYILQYLTHLKCKRHGQKKNNDGDILVPNPPKCPWSLMASEGDAPPVPRRPVHCVTTQSTLPSHEGVPGVSCYRIPRKRAFPIQSR
ncbi:hypothetical protein EST38_g13188 [Candolleomyces aberdarensis]|uniref:Uncharacterized protein n=1 Tax=Candolleomyces aberdarensis TaxID=2316362 RepID=A0A4Q2D0J0_9AGAR|nr:hypothetical protein EST38_g13188 [Candolleomyces aberdarensis]